MLSVRLIVIVPVFRPGVIKEFLVKKDSELKMGHAIAVANRGNSCICGAQREFVLIVKAAGIT